MATQDLQLLAHLMRRAGFGATRDELEACARDGYEATVDRLLDTSNPVGMSEYLIRRFHPDESSMLLGGSGKDAWLYRMTTSDAPLLEKMVLFWHGIFATGYAKVNHAKQLSDQIRMFRRYAMGDVRTLLGELSKDPAMIIWLDNQQNHKGAINENYGRELLELFSMGVGNYTEDDVKECARAFTGWTIGNREYMELRSSRDSDWPYGRLSWHFEYDAKDHDDGEKEFLGQTGRFNGEDVVDIICRQPATARFISRHLYHFFVADEPPVPQWPYEPPRDPEAIDVLSQAYLDSDYDILSMLRVSVQLRLLQVGELLVRKGEEPVRAGDRGAPTYGGPRQATLRDDSQEDAYGVHGPDIEQSPFGRGLGWRSGVDRHRSTGGEDELRVRGAGRHRNARLTSADATAGGRQRWYDSAGATRRRLPGPSGRYLGPRGDTVETRRVRSGRRRHPPQRSRARRKGQAQCSRCRPADRRHSRVPARLTPKERP